VANCVDANVASGLLSGFQFFAGKLRLYQEIFLSASEGFLSGTDITRKRLSSM
jgi:hypothetical protein